MARHRAEDPGFTAKFCRRLFLMQFNPSRISPIHIRHPDFKNRDDMILYKSFAGIRDTTSTALKTSAEYSMQAVIEDDDEIMDNMHMPQFQIV